MFPRKVWLPHFVFFVHFVVLTRRGWLGLFRGLTCLVSAMPDWESVRHWVRRLFAAICARDQGRLCCCPASPHLRPAGRFVAKQVNIALVHELAVAALTCDLFQDLALNEF